MNENKSTIKTNFEHYPNPSELLKKDHRSKTIQGKEI